MDDEDVVEAVGAGPLGGAGMAQGCDWAWKRVLLSSFIQILINLSKSSEREISWT